MAGRFVIVPEHVRVGGKSVQDLAAEFAGTALPGADELLSDAVSAALAECASWHADGLAKLGAAVSGVGAAAITAADVLAEADAQAVQEAPAKAGRYRVGPAGGVN